jgi:hypothetical protein
MKTQLLQDIGESHPSPRSLPVGDARSPDASQSKAASFPKQRIEPQMQAPGSDPGPADGDMPPFASQETDWIGKQPEDESHWFDRWGRRAATWSAGLAAAVMVAGGGLWLYNESQVETTLAVLAKNSIPARQVRASPAVPAPAAATPSAPAPEALPELKPAPPDTNMQAAPPLAETAARTAPPEAPVQPSPPEQERISPKPFLKAPSPRADPESIRARQLAETLKQCRVAGYDAEQCVQRRCLMTRYGLACRG